MRPTQSGACGRGSGGKRSGASAFAARSCSPASSPTSPLSTQGSSSRSTAPRARSRDAGRALPGELALVSRGPAGDRIRARRSGAQGRRRRLHQLQEPPLAHQQGSAGRADRASPERRGRRVRRALLRPPDRDARPAPDGRRGLWTCGQRCALPTGSTGRTAAAAGRFAMKKCPPCPRTPVHLDSGTNTSPTGGRGRS